MVLRDIMKERRGGGFVLHHLAQRVEDSSTQEIIQAPGSPVSINWAFTGGLTLQSSL